MKAAREHDIVLVSWRLQLVVHASGIMILPQLPRVLFSIARRENVP